MIDEIIQELNQLREYERKYHHAMADMERLASYVYSNEYNKYLKTSYKDRAKKHIQDTCKNCRYKSSCDKELPKDILKPTENKHWFPSYKVCKNFEWS